MELLAKHFELALETPDGIKKLRELILSLAMQGKLVSQDPKDQPASELLRMVEIEKKRLIGQGKIKKQNNFSTDKLEDIPYKIPENWEWVQLSEIGEINPRNNADDEAEAGFVPMPLIFAEYGAKHKFEIKKWSEIKRGYTHFADQDVALAKITPCFENGKSCVFEGLPNGIGAGTTELHIFRNTFNAVYPRYLLAYLKSSGYIQLGKSKMTGSAGQKRVPTEYFASNPFPLSPLKEQKRIVAKIDQLMVLCDKLETERNERNSKRLKVHTASINKLLTASDKSEFNKSWNFITKNFSELYSVPENIEELKKAILQLAVMGKLILQDPKDQPANELLKEINFEKNKLVKNKLLKIGQLTSDSKFVSTIQIPSGWEWAKGNDIFFITKLAGFEYTKYVKLVDEGEVPVIRAQNVKPLELDLRNLKYIDLNTSKLLDRCSLTKQALLVTFIGAGIGDVAIFNKPERWHLAPNVAKMELFQSCEDKIDLKFINYYLLSIYGKKEIFKHLKSTAQPSISMGTIRDIDYPIPPIAEQKRIVNKIDQLMGLCNSLQQQLMDSTKKKTDILNGVFAEALNQHNN